MQKRINTPPVIPDEEALCNHIRINNSSKHNLIPQIVGRMLSAWSSKDSFEHINPISIPSQEKIIELVLQARRIIFPGYFTQTNLHASNIEYYIGQETTELYERVTEQITMAIRHDCRRNGRPCTNCEQESATLAYAFIDKLPEITAILAEDIRSTLAGDPAIKSPDEVIFCYPGLFATLTYRLAHELYRLEVPIIPRIMTEFAHSQTGIDIHPGATIAEGFFIDHGTGVVIGETAIIGKNVRIYQGVTLGALSLPRNAGEQLKNTKRHPTIEDNVIIYSNTTILGGNTVIGKGSIIGGNNWITESVGENSKILLKKPEIIFHNRTKKS